MMATVQVHYTELDGARKLVAPDAMLREAPSRASEITDNPVERGLPVSDNIRLKGESLVIEVLVTNTPITPPLSHANGAVGVFRQSDDTKAVVLQFDQTFDRVRDMYADLARVQGLGLMFDIQSSLRDYTDFAIEQFQCERTDKTGNSARFVITFKRVRYANTAAAPVPRRVPRTLPPVPQGVQPPVAARETLAYRIGGELGWLPSSPSD